MKPVKIVLSLRK